MQSENTLLNGAKTGTKTQHLPESPSKRKVTIRPPKSHEASQIHNLISRCKPLDTNSLYCNLLQCSHFSETCSMAFIDDELAGFVSGYIHPAEENTLFIWQVAVAPEFRGFKLAKRLILDIIKRNHGEHNIKHLHTTITKSNTASWSVFKSVAKELKSDYRERVLFDHQLHFKERSQSEWLMHIGPFKADHAF